MFDDKPMPGDAERGETELETKKVARRAARSRRVGDSAGSEFAPSKRDHGARKATSQKVRIALGHEAGAAATMVGEAILSAGGPTPKRQGKEIEDDIEFFSPAGLHNLPPMTWLAEKVIPIDGITVIFGPPASGKTMLSLDIALRVATGTAWCGRTVRKGSVLFVATEGLAGLRERLRAWTQENKISESDELDKNIAFVRSRFPILSEDGLERFSKAIVTRKEKPSLIVIDTLARAMMGDENSSRDMGDVIRRCDRLRDQTGAAVLIVHHTTKKDGESERGSGALRGAADTMLSLSKENSKLVLSCAKQRNAAEFPKLHFRLEEREVGRDDDGQAITSCVVVAAAAPEPHPETGSDESGPSLFNSGREIVEAMRDKLPDEGLPAKQILEASDVPRATFYKALKRLENDGCVTSTGTGKSKRYRLTPTYRRPGV